jgi:tetratricopeptide (TPR) repeat protein
MKKEVVGVCIVLLAMTACGAKSYVEKGNVLFQQGKYEAAALNYRKAIQKDENYGEAFYRLGLTEIKEKHLREAFDAFHRAVQLLPADTDAKEQLGGLSLEIYLLDPRREQFYYDLVKQTSDELLAKNPKSFEGIREKAYLAMTDGKRDESTALFRKALKVNPSDEVVTTVLIQNLILAGQDKEAERIGLDLIARQKSYGHVYNVMYEWYMKDGRLADAESLLKTKVGNNPKDAVSLLELAAHYARVKKPAEMQATLQRLLNDPKDFPQARRSVGDFYAGLRNYPEAVRYFEEGAASSQGTDKVVYQKKASDALIAEGKNVEASSTINRIVAENPQDEEARRIRANMLLRTGNPEKVEQAEREFQDLAKQKPDDASIWLGLGRTEELRGNLSEARRTYLEALSKNKNYLEARYALAELGLVQKRADETLQEADEILKVLPEDQRARLLRAQALARTGNQATARIELTRLKDFPHDTQAQVELGLLALSEKKFQEAEQIFSKLGSTGDLRAVAGLATAYTSEKRFEKALEVLTDGLKKSNNSALLLNQLGSTQALAGKYDAAIATFQKLVALEPKSIQPRLELADTFAVKGDDHGAVEMYGEAAKLAPADLGAGLEFARALRRAGRIEEARTQYQTVLTAHPDDAMALNDMAFFICESGGNLDQALGFAQRALQSVPGQPSFSDTIGCIYLKKGMKDSAVHIFSNLVKKYPNYPSFRYHLGMALLESGDKKSAKRELGAALTAHPSRQDQTRIKELLGKIS